MNIAGRIAELRALAQADGATCRARTVLRRSRFVASPELADALDQAGDELKQAAGELRGRLLTEELA